MGPIIAEKNQQFLSKAIRLKSIFQQHQDREAALKAKEIGQKVFDNEFSIAFCGHFSAGKSSMINRLVGEDILPSSPIPTSANLVKIKAGEPYARVFFKKGKPRLYPAPYDYEEVKNLCRDGDKIESIEISRTGSEFLDVATVMDTPGIDSTDDAHRIATESALHLADIVFYVMDYNHVQSELNYLFTKELCDAGKELYLIVNMIDKHREEELSFTGYKEEVERSFQEWGVYPGRIFYTTLKDMHDSENEFFALQDFLQDRLSRKEELLTDSADKSLVKVAEKHLETLEEQAKEDMAPNREILAQLPEVEWLLIEGHLKECSEKVKAIQEQAASIASSFSKGLESILKNAYLMPFDTRELAESYLQSMEKGFKVGMIFSKQKTLQEQTARLDAFYENLSERVKSQVDWHVREFLSRSLSENGISNEELAAEAMNFQVKFNKEMLSSTIKPGAVVSGDYVLNYTSDVADALKRTVFSQLDGFKQKLTEETRGNLERKAEELAAEERRLEQLNAAYQEFERIRSWLVDAKERVFASLYGNEGPDLSFEEAQAIFSKDLDEEIWNGQDREGEHAAAGPAAGMQQPPSMETTGEEVLAGRMDVESVVRKLKETSITFNQVDALKRLSKELEERAEKLENQQFTVALFGAFSAGKSSFANALIGDKLLPVSPNPTTAAINRIKPVNLECPHGTVLVKVKEAGFLLEEINYVLQQAGLEADSLEDAAGKINAMGDEGLPNPLQNSFLKAFIRGKTFFSDQMGTVIRTNIESFSSFVADEEKSCFVEWIDVYYDCGLTRQGIILVDTPGADSIHSRHTGVAFEYIKNSDAILFVTYYNHAFSRADREFLIQLGRVKDSFEMDKMFFIINAIDLAESETEVHAVVDYVKEQLHEFGIRNPSMHPVSSLEALQDRMAGNSVNSGFSKFEKAFYSFLKDGLQKLALDSAIQKWEHAVAVLEKLIDSAEEGEDEKKALLRLNEQNRHNVLHFIEERRPDVLIARARQELEELIFYIKQRLFFRFGEFFRESFNPSLLKGDGRDMKKALNEALDDLLRSVAYDLLQEVQATSVRIEAFISKSFAAYQSDLVEGLAKRDAALPISHWDHPPFQSADFEEPFTDVDKSMFKSSLALFKSPKAFFEKNEKAKMAEQLETQLKDPVDGYLASQLESLSRHYETQILLLFRSLAADFSEHADTYYQGVETALSQDFPIAKLREIREMVLSL